MGATDAGTVGSDALVSPSSITHAHTLIPDLRVRAGKVAMPPLKLDAVPMGSAVRAKQDVLVCISVPEWDGLGRNEVRAAAEDRLGAVEAVVMPGECGRIVVCGRGVPSIQTLDEAFERLEVLPRVIATIGDRESAVMTETRLLCEKLDRVRLELNQRMIAIEVIRAQIAQRKERLEEFRQAALRVRDEAECFLQAAGEAGEVEGRSGYGGG